MNVNQTGLSPYPDPIAFEAEPEEVEPKPVDDKTPQVTEDKKDEDKTYLDRLQIDRSEEDSSSASSIKNLNKLSTSKPEDSSSELTKRLVAASGQFEVRDILSTAHKNLISLRMIASQGNGDDAKLARAYIKKLEKFIRRAQRKIEDIGEENMKKIESARAEQQQKQKRAEEIKRELEREIAKRKMRENNYLLEDIQNKAYGDTKSPALQDNNMSDAEIARLAEAMASAEIAAESTMGGDTSVDASGGYGSETATVEAPASGDIASADVVV